MNQAQPPRSRRQVYLLTAQDFVDHPVWKFCSDEELEPGQDEATVQPAVALDPDDLCVIGADAVLSDGAVLPGYLYAGDPTDPGDVQPHLLLGGAQMNFWFGSLRFRANPEAWLDACYALLGREREAIFPIRFTARVAVNGAPLTVIVTGFKASDHHDQIITLG